MKKKDIHILDTREKTDHVIQETRVVLPGTQAILGFQLASFFQAAFESIPFFLKEIHLLSLGFIALTTMLLMTPVAYHRIVEGGHDTERFHSFTSRILIIAMGLLAIGLALDIFVVVCLTLKSVEVAAISAGSLLLIFYLVWLGYPYYKRRR